MKISIDRLKLVEAVTWVARALPQRPSSPVLGGIRFEAGADGSLSLATFDYDVSARATIEVDVVEPGKVLLPGRVLTEIVKALPAKHAGKIYGTPVDMGLSGTEMVISCGAAEFGLATMPVDDFPTLPTPPETIATVHPGVFRTAVDQVAVAVGGDNTLPMLTCVCVDIDGDVVTMVATDRYRMALRDLTVEVGTNGAALLQAMAPARVMIPGKTLLDIAHGLGVGPLLICLSKHLAAFTCDGRTTTVRLLDGQFIEYRERLELDYPTWATFDVAQLTETVKRISLVAERNTPVRMSFSSGEVLVQAGGGDIGRGAEPVAVELDGDDIQIAFQPTFLLAALAGVVGERARIGLNKPTSPAVVAEIDSDDYRHLVMPIKLAS